MILGAHVSIAGGISNAPTNGKKATCKSIQIFSKNQMQWRMKPLEESEIKEFKKRVKKYSILQTVIHASYLVNLASYEEDIFEKSVSDIAEELQRAELLDIPYVVFHPGAHKGFGEINGLNRIVEGINMIFERTTSKRTKLLLETTAGEGSVLCYKFDQIAYVMSKVRHNTRVDVCFDTCHVFAAGYDIGEEDKFEQVLSEFDKIIGIRHLEVFHLNDSKFGLGSRMDRHEEIGKGKIGLEAFSYLVNNEKFRSIPGILEIPGDTEGYKRNLKILRSLINGNDIRESKKNYK